MVEPGGGDAPRAGRPVRARYADRYFGSAGGFGRHPETIDLMAGDAPAPLTDETGTDPRTSTPPPWHANAAARAALVGALVAGVLGGMYGWDRWRDREVELAARAAVDITSEVTMLGQSSRDPNQLTLSVRLHNDGPYPVTLTGLESTDLRLTPADPDFDSMEIEPESADVTVATFDYDCAAEPAAVDPSDENRNDALVARLRAIDDTEHDRGLPIQGLGLDFTSFVTDQCRYAPGQVRFGQTYPDFVDAAALGEDAVTAKLGINYMERQMLPTLVEVESRGTAFLASSDWESLVERPETGGSEITVTWTVADCATALVADESAMVLRVSGKMPADQTTTTINAQPSTGLVAELVRLAERVCH